MPIIDVFVAFDGAERKIGGDKYPAPNWKELKSYASNHGAVLNVYDIDSGTCNKQTFLNSIKTPGRIIVFAGHSWQDARLRRDGSYLWGGGVLIKDGQSFGTFGKMVDYRTDSKEITRGFDSPIPIIRASRLFIFSCNPGADFRSILRKHLLKTSIGYYVNAGTDNLVWIPTVEYAAYIAVTHLILHEEALAIKNANIALANQERGYSNGDHLKFVYGSR